MYMCLCVFHSYITLIHQDLLYYSYICSIAYFVFLGVNNGLFFICLVSIYLPLILSKLNKKKINHTIPQKTKTNKNPLLLISVSHMVKSHTCPIDSTSLSWTPPSQSSSSSHSIPALLISRDTAGAPSETYHHHHYPDSSFSPLLG